VIDVEPLIRDELERLSPLESVVRDWQAVAGERRRPRYPRRVALAAVAAVVLAAIPAVAFSAGVRSLLGLGRYVTPDYRHARLMVSSPLPNGRVARLWTAPSTQGGECEFVTFAPASSKPKATRLDGGGGGSCTVGAHRFLGKLAWGFSSASPATPPVISGRASRAVHPARVELRWHGGSRPLAAHDGYYIGAAPELDSPPFRQLPYDVVVLDDRGRVTARSRLPTSFLYRNWKQVEPKLHAYRVAHHCGTKAIWSCASR
jgi:hypothetical protein